MAIHNGEIPQPVGNTWRGFGANELNAMNIAREDWMRGEQSAQLAFQRESEFNAAEAQKNRDWQERMSNTEVQRRMEDLKKSGLNPVLAVTQGGASTPTGHAAEARSRQGSDGKGGSSSLLGDIIKTLPAIMAGLYTNGANNAAKIALAELTSKNKKQEMRYGSTLRMSEFDYMQKKTRQSNDDYFKKFNQRWNKK